MSALQTKTGSITSTGFDATFTDIHVSPKWDAHIKITADLKLSVTLVNSKGNDQTYYNGTVGVRINGKSESNSVASGSWSFSGTDFPHTKEFSNIDLTDFPTHLYLYCSECSDSGNIYGDIQFTDNRHSKVAPGAPKIESTTGTTITLKNGDLSSDCVSGTYQIKNINATTWRNVPITLTGYKQGSEHKYIARQQCICKNEYLESKNSTTGRTWSIEGSCTNDSRKTNSEISSDTLKFSVTQHAGTNGNVNDKYIRYKLYSDSNCTKKVTNADDCANGATGSITISGLNADTTYYLKAWTAGMYEKDENGNTVYTDSTKTQGKVDNYTVISGKTMKPFVVNVNSSSCHTSATTLRVGLDVTANDSTGIKVNYTVRLNGNIVAYNSSPISTSAWYVATGLSKGTTYSITYECKDAQNNISSGTIYATTKNLLVSSYNFSTKNIIINFSSSNNSNIACLLVKSLGLDVINPISSNNGVFLFNQLIMANAYVVHAELNNCFAFNTDGSINTSNNDSRISFTVVTRSLGVRFTTSSSTQYSVSTAIQTYTTSGSSNTDTGIDAVDATSFTCTKISIECVNDTESQYNTRNDIPAADLVSSNISSLPSINNNGVANIAINNLKYSYCTYKVTVFVSDGVNTVSSSIYISTTFPYVYIYKESDNKYHKAIPYVYTGNKYKPAIANVYNAGKNKYIEVSGD